MIEPTHHEESEPTSAQPDETGALESGGTSVSFRPGTALLLPELERRPWWIAPSAVVLVPLLVMILAALVIPDRIGTSSAEETQRLSLFGAESSPSLPNPAAVREREEYDSSLDEDAQHPSRPSREGLVRKPRRGFSPVRDRPESPPAPVPIAPTPPPPPPVTSESPLIRAGSNRGSQVRSVVPRPEIADEAENARAEPVPEPAEAEAETETAATPADPAPPVAQEVAAPEAAEAPAQSGDP